MAVSRGSCRGRVLWHPHMPHLTLAMLSHAISCTPIPPWFSSKFRNTPSTNQLHVFAFQVGRSVLLNKDYCLNTSSSSKKFRQGGNAWNLFDFDDQSAAFFWVDTIKYYSIPNVPSHLEGVKTRPNSCNTPPWNGGGIFRSRPDIRVDVSTNPRFQFRGPGRLTRFLT